MVPHRRFGGLSLDERLFVFTCLPQGGDGSEVAELRASLQEKIDIIESMREQVT